MRGERERESNVSFPLAHFFFLQRPRREVWYNFPPQIGSWPGDPFAHSAGGYVVFNEHIAEDLDLMSHPQSGNTMPSNAAFSIDMERKVQPTCSLGIHLAFPNSLRAFFALAFCTDSSLPCWACRIQVCRCLMWAAA